MKKTIYLSLFACASLFADADLDALKEQIAQQKLVMQKLEAKLDALSKKQTQMQQAQKSAQASAPAVNTSASFSQKAYLPDIALILNMSAVGRDVKNSDYENFAIPGFINSGDAELPFNKDRGFNFNYGELALASTVDPYFDAFAILHLHPDSLEIEEAFVRTRALPYGLRVKAGKFKSAFGRINAKHQHSWHFDSQPIIYKALFGPDSISDAGIQLQWVAPTDTYVMAGLEAMQGTNDRSFGDTEENNLYVGYVKSSVDVGDDLSILGGVSLAHGKNSENNATNPTNVYGIDLTLREQLGSYSALTWQSEYLYRNKDIGPRNDKQAGLYSELIYQYNNNYSAGFRYDAITKNDTDLSSYAGIDTNNLDRYTAMLEYKPFPMSRLRLSYTYDRTKIIAGERKNMSEVMMSLNIAAGAHGAHDY
ncbi:hypothetical protein [Sulfurimonas autotrophica]|uniref:Zinc-regulated TonB-dependent outer membrane receptor n=1 Tax=Sulfurimonas autotrophica (strain ATCC BAA-671 / DSM 16294 / JCM 11897 / OK10) TaxID=563040 RepID=E0UST5_SULAO|nr:hypothetical protein [Sulfurimonas autotrophica]ADN08112.1 conserved hypothetical protein [Sulfurimonas autotrophica DSM 16294]